MIPGGFGIAGNDGIDDAFKKIKYDSDISKTTGRPNLGGRLFPDQLLKDKRIIYILQIKIVPNRLIIRFSLKYFIKSHIKIENFQ